MPSAVALINPKFHRNVGNCLRACSNFGTGYLCWSPERIDDPSDWPYGERLPREERMKLYKDVEIWTEDRTNIISQFTKDTDFVPVAVEVKDEAESLPEFIHPENAVYVFGPEDGSLDRGILTVCHKFVTIPSHACLNLAAAVNVVLYDRVAKNPELWINLRFEDTRAYQEVES